MVFDKDCVYRLIDGAIRQKTEHFLTNSRNTWMGQQQHLNEHYGMSTAVFVWHVVRNGIALGSWQVDVFMCHSEVDAIGSEHVRRIEWEGFEP
jgi:hypothetical protein